jgi:hypothetical protein
MLLKLLWLHKGKFSTCVSLAADPASLQEWEPLGWEQPKVSLQNLLPLPSDRLLQI